jgi:hypothetical protein
MTPRSWPSPPASAHNPQVGIVAPDGDAAQRPLGGVVGHAQAAVVEEADQRVPGVEAVGDRLGDLAVGRQPGVLLAQPCFQRFDPRPAACLADAPALGRRLAVDLALDVEQGIGASHRLDGDRRLVEPCEVEELAPRMGPAHRLDDRSRLAASLVQAVEAGIGIGLHQPGVGDQVRFGVHAAAIGRVEVGRRRRIGAGKRPVIAHIGP